jgi:hypothetical protein
MNGFKLSGIGAPLIREKLECQVMVVAHNCVGATIDGK